MVGSETDEGPATTMADAEIGEETGTDTEPETGVRLTETGV